MKRNDDYFLGLPAWAFPGWKDRYFEELPSRLASYASVFNTVEGNTTFYRTPDERSVSRWLEAVAGRQFRFCFKLPREVTHEKEPDLDALAGFLDAIEPLEKHLGPLLLQFPATVGPGELDAMTPVFDALKGRREFVIEVRHAMFFSEPDRLEPVLERYRAGRVMLDSRPIFEGNRGHAEVLDALHEKPDVPVLDTVYNDVALVRLILHPDIVSNRPYIDEWARRIAACLEAGVTTYMMIHCPNNLHCPPLAREFDTVLGRMSARDTGTLPPWPVPEQATLL